MEERSCRIKGGPCYPGQVRGRSTIGLLALVAALTSCGTQEVTLEAVTGLMDESCPRSSSGSTLPESWPIRSIRLEVIEWYSGDAGEAIISECAPDIEGLAIRHPQQLINWYDERGYLVEGIPAAVPTRVQLIGFSNRDCTIELHPLGPLICGLSQDVLSESTFASGGSVPFTFACPTNSSEPTRGVFGVCLSVGTLPEEWRR